MFRRHFMQSITWASFGAVAGAHTICAHAKKTVTYQIKGFSCITCAVGLETMLREQQGILRAEASYPKANVLVEFDPTVVTDKSLQQYIEEMGFTVQSPESL
jgi:copper chaperone CopZ